MDIGPLVAAILLFSGSFVSIRYPESIRSWMRRSSLGLLPSSVRESAVDLAPTTFAIGAIVLGLGFGAAFIKSLAGIET